MAQPIDPRQVRQHGHDIDALYELTGEIKATVDAHTATLDSHTDTLADHGRQLSEISTRLDTLERSVSEGFAAILQRLDSR